MRLYRQKLRNEMGDKEYKEMVRKQQQKYRGGSVLEKQEYINQENCLELARQITDKKNLTNKRQIKVDTAVINLKMIGRIYRDMYDLEWDCKNFDWLREDVSNVIKHINNSTDNVGGIKRKYSAILVVLKHFELQSLYDTYYQQFDKYKTKVRNDIEENTLSNFERENGLDWETIISQVRPVILKTGSLKEKIMILLYTDIPPRRNEFLQYMKLITKGSLKQALNLDPEFNYFHLKTGNIVVNKYKPTARSIYGQQVLKYPTRNVKLIKQLLSKNFKNGDLLFSNRENKPLKSFNKISPMFQKYTGKMLGSRLLRHSFVTNYVKLNPAMTIKQKKEIARQLGHSAGLFDEYLKVGLL